MRASLQLLSRQRLRLVSAASRPRACCFLAWLLSAPAAGCFALVCGAAGPASCCSSAASVRMGAFMKRVGPDCNRERLVCRGPVCGVGNGGAGGSAFSAGLLHKGGGSGGQAAASRCQYPKQAQSTSCPKGTPVTCAGTQCRHAKANQQQGKQCLAHHGFPAAQEAGHCVGSSSCVHLRQPSAPTAAQQQRSCCRPAPAGQLRTTDNGGTYSARDPSAHLCREAAWREEGTSGDLLLLRQGEILSTIRPLRCVTGL